MPWVTLLNRKHTNIFSFFYRKSEEEKKGDEAHRVVADIVMASYLATERAAVLDPKIAEQNRRIAEQKKAWEEAQQK